MFIVNWKKLEWSVNLFVVSMVTKPVYWLQKEAVSPLVLMRGRVQTYLHICTHMHTYMHTHAHTCLHTSTHTHARTLLRNKIISL